MSQPNVHGKKPSEARIYEYEPNTLWLTSVQFDVTYSYWVLLIIVNMEYVANMHALMVCA